MPGKKRKGNTAHMPWASSPSPSGTAGRRKGGSSGNSSRRGDGGGGGGAGPAINESKAAALFDELCEMDNPDTATMEDICKLCERLGLDPLEDVRVLVLLWKLGATKKPAEIQREEWLAGCRRLGLDSIAKFKKLLPGLDTGFLDRREFGDFYKFCFQFNLAGTHRTLDKDLAIALLKLCLAGGRSSPHRLDTFAAFLEASTDASHGRITLDQWRSFLEFGYEYPDAAALEGYDEAESAWPVLIDEYVDYMESTGKE